MAKSTHFDKDVDNIMLTETLKDASWCRRCAKNCHCVANADGNFTYSVISDAYYKDAAGDCKECRLFTG